MTPLELHPLCALFPALQGSEFDALREDISANGQRQPIVLLDGQILDGANRYRACLAANIEPQFENFTGADVVAFVLSVNLHRRHMTPGQQAAAVASVQDWAEAQRRGGDGSNQHSSKGATLPPFALKPCTVADRAALSGASTRTQKMADKVARADPELARQVAQGHTTLPQALATVKGRRRQTLAQGVADAEQINDDLDAAFVSTAELMADLERESRDLKARIDILLKEDGRRAETLRWRQAVQAQHRRSDELLGTIAQLDREIAVLSRRLKRCGKAVGESDPDKVVLAVEAFVRRHPPAAQVSA